jgi:hypothetical protein
MARDQRKGVSAACFYLYLFILLTVGAGCNRLPKRYHHQTLYLDTNAQVFIQDTGRTNFSTINAYRVASTVPIQLQKAFANEGFRITDDSGKAQYHAQLLPLLLVADGKWITISDSVKGELKKSSFFISTVIVNISWRFIDENGKPVYHQTFTEKIEEVYKTRTIKNNALLYSAFTNTGKWETQNRIQLKREGFNENQLEGAYSRLIKKSLKSFKKAARKKFPESVLSVY